MNTKGRRVDSHRRRRAYGKLYAPYSPKKGIATTMSQEQEGLELAKRLVTVAEGIGQAIVRRLDAQTASQNHVSNLLSSWGAFMQDGGVEKFASVIADKLTPKDAGN